MGTMDIRRSADVLPEAPPFLEAIKIIEPLARELGPLRIICVRHGQTDFNKQLRIIGQHDIPLNGDGLAQADRLFIPDMENVGWVFSSDLQRAQQTAQVFLERQKTRYTLYTDARLREISLGEYEGKYQDVFKQGTEYDVHYVFPGGESYYLLLERLCSFVVSLLLMYKRLGRSSDALLFGHAGPWRIMRSFFSCPASVGEVFTNSLANCGFETYDSAELSIPTIWASAPGQRPPTNP